MPPKVLGAAPGSQRPSRPDAVTRRAPGLAPNATSAPAVDGQVEAALFAGAAMLGASHLHFLAARDDAKMLADAIRRLLLRR